ncbi:adenosylcobinamide-phosphate guanylyltransferase [Paenibacillus sp. FSL R7-0273]|uniref:bifunctional adenosylcobinamide kinase/adenosylcobinamide-phosphate guanylyltransferase n=1 Tax=Paenibacillus sp. FSL R7-0273 TaxID=1536772 RepID=UPI0004F92A39|nr:bifunctional adenosylcobinamide kinase/adenosylcobinamide-phosphate guanylyltransferase [Paenibacillus sp. FSL R7-0273]AIQ45517.1 adenosylcobinamide-phosphate guanylyltransferase [Paenibacillus sp. FSL R7-0273]OMF89108.1 bifunctional adenosylcobinamide kinase/adenosylcobinamide-phosphate guanylyltransferase [Paenibacillus sp. FSL R7-0273]
MSILVTGGARSGKSSFAERLTLSLAEQAVYVATGQAFDEEMKARIALHRRQREESGGQWETVEEPHDLPGVLGRLSGSKAVLVDCLTLWLSNVLLAVEGEPDRQERVEEEIARLEESVSSFQGTLVLVTNEVGDGIVPEYALGRLYRDLAGRMNARLAAHSRQVFLVTAGIPVELKSREYKL